MPESILTPDIWDALRQLSHNDGERVAVMSALAHAKERVGTDSQLDAARAAFAAAERSAREASTRRRELEAAIEDGRLKVQRTELRISSGQLHHEREISAAQHELTTLQATIADNENAWLSATDREESAQAAILSVRERLEAEERNAAGRRAAAERDVQDAEKRLASIDAVRREAAQKLPSELRERYRVLYPKTGGRPFAEAVAGECSYCHRSVPASAVQMLRTHAGVPSCPSCGRLLLLP